MFTAMFGQLLSGFLMAVLFLPQVKTSSSSNMSTSLSDRAYFNESGFLNIPHIWQLKSNSGLSFRTCSNGNGKLLHQVGATGNSLTLALNNGILNFQWQIDNSLSDVTVGEKLNDNSWYFVMFDYRLGNLRVKVQKGSDTLFSKLIANNTHNENIWKIKLENGSSLQLGLHFTGCLMSGPNVDLKLSNSTGTVYNGCFNEELKCNNCQADDGIKIKVHLIMLSYHLRTGLHVSVPPPKLSFNKTK